jgi:ketosteroid isomerase-like protein
MPKQSHRMVIAALSVLTLSACATLPGNNTQEELQLMQISREWSDAAASGDLDRIVSYWGEDATVMMAGLPTFRGKNAIRGYVAESLKVPGFKISWEPLEAHVSASGDMGYIVEKSQVTLPDSTGKLTTTYSRAVTVWRKDADGRWRNVVDISNQDPGRTPGR